ncbi:type IV conjugative transfer system coupling protein TraD [Klebsiella pneumoniae]
MSGRHVTEALLRPAVEFYSALTAFIAAVLCLFSPWALALSAQTSLPLAGAFLLLTAIRAQQGWHILRYRRNLRRLRRYALSGRQIPCSQRGLFLGRGFRWEARHTQRLHECYRPEAQRFLRPGIGYRLARWLENHCESRLPLVTRWLSLDSPLNPWRPLPPTGGNAFLHGIELREHDITLPLTERPGHTLVIGTTRTGKTRLAELLLAQDIQRGEVVIILDPKGDADLLKRAWTEARRAGREADFYLFHLGWPALSARYNAIGRFSRLSEVASRLAGQLSGEGNSAAFREFAWRFVNIIARALVALGLRPDYRQIARHVVNIDALFIDYARSVLPDAWQSVAQIAEKVNDKNTPRNLQGRDRHVVALEMWLGQSGFYDPVLDGLRSAVRYDRTYFDKIVASLLPLLEKLTSGNIAPLLSPDYTDLNDSRPLLDWQRVIRQRGIVYVGLDALSDSEVAAAVGNSMFADLVSIAGWLYKFGPGDGLPDEQEKPPPINLHCDEFNELMGPEFIPLINKGGGANLRVTAYTQTLSDIEARTGSRAQAGQVVGNFNNLIMLRVRETATAELLTGQLPEVEILTSTVMSGVTDTPTARGVSDFVSTTQDHIASIRTPLLPASALMQLPKGQAFALIEGGQLWKLRIPLPAPDRDDHLPEDIRQIAQAMRQRHLIDDGHWRPARREPV